ncbi:hypothetical protein [Crenalkalicoccus roseus]|uniref:hypothetical protein n=1 Tax=Crenalkalicoccus roseus TaxID=1485588 RepID=UPI0010821791|nr:hypothetical protein [Crenalkalicoccus roseus]
MPDPLAAPKAPTPGPWRLDPDDPTAVLGPNGLYVAECAFFFGAEPEETEACANARLIAAAPDLLATLRGLVAAVEAGAVAAPALAEARAALARAGG